MSSFTTIPLQYAEATAVFDIGSSADIDVASRVRAATLDQFRSPIPLVRIGEVAGYSPLVALESQPTLLVENDEHATALGIHPDGITVRWGSGAGSQYPGYEFMRASLVAACEGSGLVVGSVRITYRVVQPREDMTVGDLIQAFWVAGIGQENVLHESITNYRMPSGVDYRISALNLVSGLMVGSDGGLHVEDNNVEGSLDLLHEAMVNEFATLITPRAKELWGFQE